MARQENLNDLPLRVVFDDSGNIASIVDERGSPLPWNSFHSSVASNLPRTVAGVGDSVMAGAFGGASLYAQTLSRYNFQFHDVGNFSLGGSRLEGTGIAAQIAKALAAGAKTVIHNGGINNYGVSDTEQLTRDRFIANINAIRAGGARPIDIGMPPSNTPATASKFAAHELWRKLWCYKNNVQHADIWTPLATSAGAYAAGYNGDVTHPNSVGTSFAIKNIQPHIVNQYTATAPLLAMTDTASDYGSFINNAISFSGTINSNGWWTLGTGGTYSVTAPDANDLGSWLRCTMTAGTSVGFNPTAVTIASLGWNVGDRIATGFRVRWGDVASGLALGSNVNAGDSTQQPMFNELGGPGVDSMTVYRETTIQPGAVSIGVNFFGTGTGWFEVQRPVMVNLTKLGLA